MFDATRGGLHECFLDRPVQVAIGGHIAEPTVSEDSGEQLTHTGCQCSGAEVGWGCGVIRSRTLPNQFDSCNFPLGWYLQLGPAVVEKVY